jgi:hypothetical protein
MKTSPFTAVEFKLCNNIFHTKMLQNALWCQITWSKCMSCNILEYCSQTLDIHGQRVLQLILFLLHCTCILTETIKIYQEKVVELKKIQS